MYINDLALEITRRCNIRCDHCLRGPAQQMDMDRDVIFNVFRQIDSIGMLTITGGEPFLKPEIMEDIVQQVIWQKTDINSFYIVTNATVMRNRIRMLEALDRLKQFCDEPSCCSLQYSGDQYHRAVRGDPNLKYFDGYDMEEYGEHYFKEVEFYHGSKSDYIYEALREGRAETTQLGSKDPEQQEPWEIEEYNNELQVVGRNGDGMLYIAANGNIGPGCNMSFRRFDKEAKGNILTDNLEDVIRSYCVTEEEEAVAA